VEPPADLVALQQRAVRAVAVCRVPENPTHAEQAYGEMWANIEALLAWTPAALTSPATPTATTPLKVLDWVADGENIWRLDPGANW
jgi:hypothetical protein